MMPARVQAPLSDTPEGTHASGLPPAFWVSSGVAAAALTSFTVFSLLGHARQSNLSECSPGCSPSHRADFDAMHRDYLIGDISLGVAVASAGAATWFFLSSHSKPSADQARAQRLVERVAVVPSGAGVSLVVSSGRF